MALTRTQVSQLFVAIFNRASEGLGNQWWQEVSNNMEHAATEMLKTQDAKNYFGTSLDDNQAFVELIFKNTLNRTPEDGQDVQDGIAFWVDALDNGASRGFVVAEMIKAIEDYGPGGSKYNPNDAGTTAAYNQFTNRVIVSNYLSLKQQETLADYGTVTVFNQNTSTHSSGLTVTDQASTVASAQLIIDNLSANVFTLTEAYTPGEAAVAAVTKVYWGYNMDDDGIPVADLLSFLTTITGLDLHELGIIDDDGVGPFDSVDTYGDVNIKDLSSLQLVLDQLGPTAGGMLTVNFADGSSKNAEVELGQQYVNFLQNLLYYTTYDGDGNPTLNSRLFEKVITPGTDATGATLVPIYLTPATNNGGTIEAGVTGNGNDLIVAGRLELLHQAYIDGGYGYDILEIDAKGVYAQPRQLLNIEEVRVHNMANVYTTLPGIPAWQVDGDGDLVLDGSGDPIQVVDENGQPVFLKNGYLNNSTYPYLSGDGPTSSFIDLSRATSIKKLVVNEAYDSIGGSGQTVNVGPLTIVGVRNDAITRLEGGFTENVTIQYGQGLNGTLELELALGDVTADINLLQNAAVINIDSQGIENHMHVFFAGGSISRMYISGTGVFAVDENLALSFNSGRPVIIDASDNTGGLDVTLADGSGSGDLGFSNVKVIGTEFDDEITVTGITKNGIAEVIIEAGNGKNTIDASDNDIVSVTTGTGNDIITAEDCIEVTIVAGDGKNVIDTDGTTLVNITTGTGNDAISSNGSDYVTITSGEGNDAISARNALELTIDAGDGNNSIQADWEYVGAGSGNGVYGQGIVNITTGSGNDTISALRHNMVTIDAGAGTNKITTSALEINITTGDGNDTLYISGIDSEFDFGDQGDALAAANNDWNDDNYVDNDHFVDNDAPGALLTLNLGAGSNTVYLGIDETDVDAQTDVDTQLGVTALEGSVITGTGIKLFVENHSDLTQADLTGATITSVVLKQELRITDDQFTAIGSSAFSVFRDEEGATEDLYIVIGQDGQESVTLSSLVNLATLNTNVRLHFELHNNSTLTLSAEELHKYVSWHGIDSTDGLNGKVVITNAGQNFDPFDNGNNYQVVDGGSLTDTFAGSEDVTIIRSLDGGYERPTPGPSTDTLVLDSNVDPVIETAINSEVATLKIVGDADITFDHTVNLGRDAAAAVLADGTQGDLVAPETDAYTIDFSALNGDVLGLVLANFQDVKEVKGNGSATRDVRIDVELTNGSSVGAAGNNMGLKTSGVQTYVVTAIGDDSVGEDSAASSATFYVCDLSQDVTTLGLRGNYNDTINFMQVKWGTNFLLEAGGDDKADGNPSYANIGNLHAEYFWDGAGPHAAAVVDINNQGVALTKPINVASIDIDNADSITVNVADGDLVVGAFSGDSLNALTVVSANDVQLGIGANLLDGIVGNSGALVTSIIDGTAVAGDFVLNLTGDNNFSLATLTGIDGMVLNDNVDLVLSADQAVTLGAVIEDNGAATTLSVTGFGTQALDLSLIDVDTIGTVTFTDAGTAIQVDPGANFGDAASVRILAETSDSAVTMTAGQFGTITGGTVNVTETGTNKASLVLTDLVNDETLTLTNVNTAVDIVLQFENITATADMIIADATAHIITLEFLGTNDLTLATLPVLTSASGDKVHFTGDATVTLTAAQFASLPDFTDANGDGAADNWIVDPGATVVLNITGVSNGFALDLNKLAGAGIDIGTLTLTNSNAAITLGGAATLGGADSIITPTKDGLAGSEPVELTTLSLTAAQFNQLEGTGTITGDGTVYITGLTNNTDVNGDNILNASDAAIIDVTGITAPKGTVTLGSNSVTLDSTSSLAGFEIKLSNGQMIRFNTEGQASGAKITEVNPGSDVTAVVWLFDSITAPINTSLYNGSINHLYILTSLVDGTVEEDLWTTLQGSIVVEKYDDSLIPNVLTGFARINTFEALTSVPAGINYDNPTELETTTTITMNLEGNVTVGNVLVGDTNGTTPQLQSLTVNSYEDRSSLAARGLENNNYIFLPNIIGNIGLNAGSLDNLVNVTLNTYADADNVLQGGDPVSGSTTSDGGFYDVVNVNAAVAERDGLALEVGTITFAANATTLNPTTNATLTIAGQNDVTIGGVDISDDEVNLLTIDASAHVGAPDADLVIGGIVPTGGDAASNALGSFAHIYVVDDGYIAPAAAFGTAGNNLLVVAGNADLSAATATDIDQVHFTQDAILTLTGAQVAAISQADGADTDLAADAWSALAGLNVTLNIVGMTSADIINLNNIALAGINIGTITMATGTQTINAATTLGDADSIIIPADGILNLTAAQFDQLAGTGTITSLTPGVGQVAGLVNITSLMNTLDDNDADSVADDYTFLDVTLVTATHGTITLGAADVSVGNIAANVHSILGTFTITLDDIDSAGGTPNELAGQTIRFSTALQAERTIIVTGEDPPAGWVAGDPERDTNVVWLFNTITGTVTAGKIDTHNYDGGLGRVWVNDALVDGANIESIFSGGVLSTGANGLINLNSTTIIRVVNTADLSELLPENLLVDRTVEVEAFTQLPLGLIFSNPDLLVSVDNLTLDLGGVVTMGPLSIDNILAPSTANGDEFGGLIINSLLANTDDHYLLPETWDTNVNPRPDELALALQHNVIGTISSGATRGELARVTINATGTSLDTGVITFTDDGGLTPADLTDDDPTAVLTVTGSQNINISSVDTSDTDITAITVVSTGYTGTLTAPGTSPAFALNNTQTLTFDNGGVGANATITITADGVDNNDETLTVNYTLDGVAGTAVVVTLDATIDATSATEVAAAVATALNAVAGISANSTGGVVSAWGDGNSVLAITTVVAGGTTNGLAGADTDEIEGGTITLGSATNAGIAGNELSIINGATFGGTLNLGMLSQLDSSNDTADLNNDGDMNDTGEVRALTFRSGTGLTTATLAAANGLTPTLNAGSEWSFDYTGADKGSYLKITPTVVLAAGSTLRLNNVPLVIEGAVSLTHLLDNVATTTYVEGLIITGGSIEVLSGSTLTLLASQVVALNTAGVNIIGAGTLIVTGDASNLTLGANIKTAIVDISAVTLIAAPAVGADADDTVALTALTGATVGDNTGLAQTIIGSANDDAITTTGAGNDIITGGAGDDTLTGGAGNDTYNVNSGTDTVVGLVTGDVLVVSAGATANADLGAAGATAGSFVATALTSNNGTAVLTDVDVSLDSTIDMSLAIGTKGYTITGGTSGTLGTDTLVGSDYDDTINGGNGTQSAAAAADVLTGNDGADTFNFDVTQATPVASTPATGTPGSDVERWDFDPNAAGNATAFAADNNGVQALTVLYRNNQTSTSFTINDDATIDFTDGDAIGTRIALELSSRGVAASFDAVNDLLTLTGTAGQSVEITSLTPVAAWAIPADAPVQLAGYDVANDVAQISTVLIGDGTGGAVTTAGDIYRITLTLAEGSAVTFEHIADGTETEIALAGALATGLNGLAGGAFTAANGGTSTITLTDLAADNGGFTFAVTSSGGITGTGASALGAADYLTSDIITDFVSGEDIISFGLGAGVAGSSYLEAAVVADYATALAAANAAFFGDPLLQYYLTSATDLDGAGPTAVTSGLLFFDANLDGTADGVVRLTGISNLTFAATDIHA